MLEAPERTSLHDATLPPIIAARADIDGGIAAYAALTGQCPAQARIGSNHDFDRHVLASLLSIGISDGGALAARLGLSDDDLAELVGRWFPHAGRRIATLSCDVGVTDDDEVAMVRDLLLAHRSTPGEEGRWLAAMIARRAIEPNHLWEDLGLRDRGELSRLLGRHFAPLAARNTRNMRWKRFFYRTLCESDGLVMCSTPVCSSCGDFELCFGQEDGESRLAYTRRRLALKAAAA